MKKINNSLTEPAREQFRAGNMGVTAAYETARLPPEDQKIIAEKAAEQGGVEGKEIAAIVKERKEEEKQAKKRRKNLQSKQKSH
uniref:hypothetical protein n=1 Tax=Clostridium sp. NkU-1 TaxID=1095009 RepID=UPI0006D11539